MRGRRVIKPGRFMCLALAALGALTCCRPSFATCGDHVRPNAGRFAAVLPGFNLDEALTVLAGRPPASDGHPKSPCAGLSCSKPPAVPVIPTLPSAGPPSDRCLGPDRAELAG